MAARIDVDLSTPTNGSRRGPRFGSDLMYGSDRSGNQKSEPYVGGFGSPVCIESPMPAACALSHSEQMRVDRALTVEVKAAITTDAILNAGNTVDGVAVPAAGSCFSDGHRGSAFSGVPGSNVFKTPNVVIVTVAVDSDVGRCVDDGVVQEGRRSNDADVWDLGDVHWVCSPVPFSSAEECSEGQFGSAVHCFGSLRRKNNVYLGNFA